MSDDTKRLKDLPSLSEKVQFWEEQDKINQILIPRVIEMSERVEDLGTELSNINTRIARIQSQSINGMVPESERGLKYAKLMAGAALVLSLLASLGVGFLLFT